MLLARKLELDQRVRGFKELAFTESERGSLRRTDVARLFIPTQTGVLAWIPFMRMWHDVEYRHNLDVLQMLRALTPDSPDAETLDRFTVPFERAAEQGKSTLILPRRENRALHEWLNDFAQPRS
ncbi:MAG: hypothetical protein A49_31820 [Methyloceanibacter sp.]|nr:MAG: hypothetical protein A49_31820 [Methyloceanibacter sp.]